MISFQELATFNSVRDWTLTGSNALVKVVSIEDVGRPAATKVAAGYVTQAKFIKGLNALQIESALGLRPHSLRRGAYVLYFARLPEANEVRQRFTADFPDGKEWGAETHDKFMAARDAVKTSGSEVIDFYPPGSAATKQWKLVRPVPLSGLWKLVTPSMPFQV